MRSLEPKNRSLYVWNFIQLNLSRLLIFTTLFIVTTILFVIDVRPYSSLGLLLIPIAYLLGVYTYMRYMKWNSGPMGEGKVLAELRKLSNDYVMLRNAVIPPSKGDTDYIIVGPNGLFVIEAKNVGGVVSCDGDEWSRHKIGKKGGRYELEVGNPSKQTKRSAKTVKDYILENSKNIFKEGAPHIWVYSILVFTNPNVSLKLKNPTVEVLGVSELRDFILKQKGASFTKEQIDSISETLGQLKTKL